MVKQKFEATVDVPDGYEIVDYRKVQSDEHFLGDRGKVVQWPFIKESLDNAMILRKIPQYRDPVLPADWGKKARFSFDGINWADGILASYAAHYADDKNRWGAASKPFWYKFCQVVDE